jgi:HEAT repeat protein
MKTKAQTTLAGELMAAAMAPSAAAPAAAAAAADLVTRIRSQDDDVRGDAWQKAGPAGAPAVQPLAALLTDSNFEVARSAKRAMWQIVHYAGRPEANAEAKAVETALIPLLKHSAPVVRREALWMLSEVGSDAAVVPMAALLADAALREDARCALQRIPGDKSLQALRDGLKSAPEDFRHALAESLRKRGEKVDGYPSRKLVPTRTAKVG